MVSSPLSAGGGGGGAEKLLMLAKGGLALLAFLGGVSIFSGA